MTSHEPSQLQEVKQAVDQFWKHLADYVPRPKLVQIGVRDRDDKDYREHKKRTGWAECWGVYLYFSRHDGAVLYIGLAINQHPNPLEKQYWQGKPNELHQEYGAIYAFTFERMSPWGYLLPALEVYLLSEFKPKEYNRINKHLPLPAS